MVTLFYTKIHNEFFIFLGVALHYTIYHMKKSFIFKGLTHFGYMYKIELNEKEKVNT